MDLAPDGAPPGRRVAASRRHVIRGAAAAPALGVATLRLPAALAATSVAAGSATPPDGPTVTPDDTRVSVSWTEADGVAYAIEQSTDGTTWSTAADPATSPTTVEGLTNDQAYAFRIVAVSDVTLTGAATTATPRAAMLGGTESVITVDGAAWRVHRFDVPGSATLEVRASRDVEYLIVGGGGAGGGGYSGSTLGGGGGGAGGLLTNVAGTPVTVASDVTVVVGPGGTPVVQGTGGDGGSSTALGLTATGGGGGGGGVAAGRDGGSGGGGGGFTNSYSIFTIGALNDGGAGTAGQGSAGGASEKYYGAGGGGAGGRGANATTSTAGAGGAGRSSGITGVDPAPTYARGGDGAANADNSGFTAVVDGTGDGGFGRSGSTSAGGAGAGGVVILRYAI